jgi:hypothetical protein
MYNYGCQLCLRFSEECKKVVYVLYEPVAVALYLIVLAVMRIFVIYKCLSWYGDQQRDLGKPS